MKRICFIVSLAFIAFKLQAQVKWINVDSLFGNLPPSVHVYKTTDPLDGKPNIAYYLEADLKDRRLNFTSDTTHKRRLTPQQFYTKNNKLIILVIEGRNKGVAEGASLMQEAKLFKELGCREALNLDGGGSSCMLVNGKETISPSDKKQRPVPAVFIIEKR